MSWKDKATGLFEPDFVKIYISELDTLKSLTGGQRIFLDELIKRAKYGNRILCRGKHKKELLDALGIGDGALRNLLSALTKKDIIKRNKDVPGLYIINPSIVYKGKQSDRAKVVINYLNNDTGNIKIDIEE